MRRDLGQMSFAAGLVNQRAGRNRWLDRIDKDRRLADGGEGAGRDLCQRRGAAVVSSGDVCEAASASAMVRFV